MMLVFARILFFFNMLFSSVNVFLAVFVKNEMWHVVTNSTGTGMCACKAIFGG